MQDTNHEQTLLNPGINRRTALRLIVSGGSMAILAACGQATPAATTSAPTSAAAPTTAPAAAAKPTTAPAAPAAPAATTAPAAAAKPAAAATTAPAQASTVKTSGTLNVALADLETENMDTILAQPNLNVVPLIYETLLEYDDKGNLTPWLAESWDMSPDGLTWTFNVRKGVKFTNGDELTSNDVKSSIERYVSDASQSAWSPMHRQTVATVDVPDKYTVKVSSKSPPYLFYPDAIAGTWIHNKAYLDKVGLDTFSKQPIGTGPWKLDKITPSVSAELSANPEYWGTPKPVWDKLVLLNTPEESTRIAQLKRGEADVVGISWDNALSLRDAGYQLRQTRASTLPALFFMGYWAQQGPTSDPRVREALEIGINRQELCDSFFKGFAKPNAGNFAITDLHYGFDPVWYSTQYEPDRAKQLLQDAGYPGKFQDPTLNIFTVTQVGWEPDFLQVISGYWQALGVKTQLVPMDFTAMRNGWVNLDPKMSGGVVTWIGTGGGSAGNSMPAQQNNFTSKGVNQSAHDTDLDKMFADMIAQLDANKRMDEWHQVQQKAYSLHSILGVARVFDQYAVSDKVGDWTGQDYLANAFIIGLTGVQHR